MGSFCLRPLRAGSELVYSIQGIGGSVQVLAVVRISMRRVTALIALSSIASAAGYIVQDNDARLQYEGVWSVSQDGSSSGGTEHRTNMPGARVILSNFTGCAAAVSGCAACNGARFTFAILGDGPTVLCTASANSTTEIYRKELCSIGGIKGKTYHTLVITHNDTVGRWLNFDFLNIGDPELPPVGTTILSASETSTPSPPSSIPVTTSSSPPILLSTTTGSLPTSTSSLILSGQPTSASCRSSTTSSTPIITLSNPSISLSTETGSLIATSSPVLSGHSTSASFRSSTSSSPSSVPVTTSSNPSIPLSTETGSSITTSALCPSSTPSSPFSTHVTTSSDPLSTDTGSLIIGTSSLILSGHTGTTPAPPVSLTPTLISSTTHHPSVDTGVLIVSIFGALCFLVIVGVAAYVLYRRTQHQRRMREYALPPERGSFFDREQSYHGFRGGDMIAWDPLPNSADLYTISYTDPYSTSPAAAAACPPRRVLDATEELSPHSSPDSANRRELESATLLPSHLTFAHSPSSEHGDDNMWDSENSPSPPPILRTAPRAFRPLPMMWASTPSSGEVSTSEHLSGQRLHGNRSDRITPKGPRPR